MRRYRWASATGSAARKYVPSRSLEIGSFEYSRTKAGRVEREIRRIARLGKRFGETYVTAGQASIVFDRHQDVRWPTAIRDEDRPAPGQILGAARVPTEFATGQDSHGLLDLRTERFFSNIIQCKFCEAAV
jgi:hypothetical protein